MCVLYIYIGCANRAADRGSIFSIVLINLVKQAKLVSKHIYIYIQYSYTYVYIYKQVN